MAQPFRAHPTHSDYGQRWGEGAARCFSLEGDFDEDEGLRLTPIPESFICPMTQNVMEDPVMTVDGCTYERSYIEQWIRHRQQQRQKVTSPLTNQELPSHRLLSLTALRKAIEAYLTHRPELITNQMTSRTFEEAALVLQGDLLEKQQIHESTKDELSMLRDSNEVLFRALRQAESHAQELEFNAASAREELEHERRRVACLEEQVRKLEESQARRSRCLPGLHQHEPRKDVGRSSFVHLAAVLAILLLIIAAPALRSHSGFQDEGPLGTTVSNPAAAALQDAMLPHGDLATIPGTPPLAPPNNESEHQMWNGQAISPAPASSTRAGKKARKSKERSGNIKDRGPRSPGTPAIGRSKREVLTQDLRSNRKADDSPDGSRTADVPEDEIITKQVELLQSGTLEEKTEAALVLGVLAATGQNQQAAIVRAGAVSPLVALLSSEAPEARGQAAVALKTLAANNTYNKVVIVRSGAVPLLIKLLKEDSFDIQKEAEGALQHLAEMNNQVEIAQAGAIVPLVALLKDSDPGVRSEAVGALVILALNADNQVAIAQVGAIPMLVDLLKDSVPEVREQAAAALRNLAAQNTMDPYEIAKVGVLSPLTDLVKDGRSAVKQEALETLRNMAVHDSESTVPVKVAAAVAGHAIKEAAENPSQAGGKREAWQAHTATAKHGFPAWG